MKEEIIRFDELASTNEYAKSRIFEKRNLTIIAKKQFSGRGTRGRAFSSEEGGLYISFLRFYENYPAKKAFLIMQKTAVAVCQTLAFYGLRPKIKWPNDIYVNGKKICGILIENTFSGKNIFSSIVGVGLNVFNPLPIDLVATATTMKKELNRQVAVEEVSEKLIEYLKTADTQDYSRYLGFIGDCVFLTLGEEVVSAQVLGVDEQGGLLVEINGEEKRFASAEISLRVREEK